MTRTQKIFQITFTSLSLLAVTSACATPGILRETAAPAVKGASAELPLTAQIAPVLKSTAIALEIEAEAALALDLTSNRRLFEKATTGKRQPASLAKLATAIVVLNLADPNQVVEVLPEDLEKIPAPLMGLQPGEKITIDSLLRGMLVMSANDAALTLARSTAGSRARFVELMNLVVRALGMKNTAFKNSAGFDEPGQFSTADDLALLAQEALGYSKIAQTVVKLHDQVSSADGSVKHWLAATNTMLRDSEVRGVKTGFTDEARGNLILLIETADKHKILTVLLGSERREEESGRLKQWLYDSYTF